MAEIKSTIKVDVDATGAQTGAASANKAIGSIGQTAKKTAEDLKGMPAATGAGMQGAEEVAKATDRTIGAWASRIKSTIIDVKAAGDAAARYELKAIDKGIPKDVYEPYVAELRRVQAEQKKLADSAVATAAGVSNSVTPRLNELGMTAKGTAAALRQVPAQFTDIIVSLQGGQAPLTVLLQQGGQLKDVFGGIVPAAKALGGYIMGLVNPFTLAAAGAAAFGYAYYQGSQQANEFTKAVVLSGNAVGTTSAALQANAKNIASVTGSYGTAAAAVAEFAASGRIGIQNLESFSQAAIQFEKATGTAVSETVKHFVELGKSPVDASLRLNEQYNYLTASIYQQIKALQDQGRAAEAADLAQKTFADTIASRASQIVANTGYIERAWNSVKRAISGATDAAMSFGRAPTSQDRVEDKRTQIENLQKLVDSGAGGTATVERRRNLLEMQKQELSLLTESERVMKRTAESQSQKVELNRLGVEFAKQGAQYESNADKRKREVESARTTGQRLVNEGLLTEIELKKRIAAIEDRYKDPKGSVPKSGAPGVGETEVAGMRARMAQEAAYLTQLRERGGEAQKLTFFEEAAIRVQEQLKTSMTGATRAQKEKALAVAQSGIAQEKEIAALERRNKLLKQDEETLDKQVDAAGKIGQTTMQRAIEQEAANAVYGKGKVAIEELRLAQMRQQAAEADSSDRFSPAYVAALNTQTEAQQRLVNAMNGADFKAMYEKQSEYARNAEEMVRVQAEEVQMAGLTGAERERIVVTRRAELELAKQIAEINRSGYSDDQKQQLREMAQMASEKTRAAEIGRSIADEGRKTADSLRNSLTDALMSGFEKGKGFLENLRDTAVNMFKTLILRPTVQAIVTPVSQAVSGVVSQVASSAMGSSSMLGSLGSLGGALGQGLSAGFSALMGESGIVGALSAGMTSIGTATATGITAGLGTIAGALGPIAIGVGLLGSLFSGKKDNRQGAGYSFQNGATTLNGGASKGVDFANQSVVVNSVALGINSLFERLGSSERIAQFGAGFESSRKGKGFSFAGGSLQSGAEFGQQNVWNNRGSKTIEEAMAQYQIELKQATLQALQAATDVPKVIRGQLAGVNIDALGAGDLDGLIAAIDKQIAGVQAFRTAVAELPFENLKRLSFDAASGLLAAAGGLEKLGGNLSTYFDNFYSDAEKRQQQISAINRATAGSGLDAGTASRAQFRKMVEAQDLNTEAGQAMYAALLSVAGAFASVTQEAGTANDAINAVEDAQKDLIDAYKRQADALQSTVEKFRSFSTELRSFRDGLLLGNLSTLTPGQRYAEAGQQFDKLLQATRTGTTAEREDASGKLQEAANSLLEASRVYNASGAAYTMDFDRVREALNEASINAAATADVAQLQLDATRSQLTALGEIDKSVLSVEQAIRALADAQRLGGQMPAFASGGEHKGGWAMVGERGPERVYMPPARIFTASDSASMGAANDNALAMEVRNLREEVRMLREQQSQETSDVIRSNYDANARNAQALAALESRNAWSKTTKVELS